MNLRTQRPTMLAALVALSIMGLGLGGTTATAQTSAGELSGLDALAFVFNELPASGGTTTAAATCGQSGHCNSMTCPEPTCGGGKQPYCDCKPTEIKCQDTHDWYDPFDNDEHNMYECSCGCTGQDPDPEPDCIELAGGYKICRDDVRVPELCPRYAVPHLGDQFGGWIDSPCDLTTDRE